ncbi:hypothetical protein FQA39_LY12927 [Lamprigera yunnana]|nr:hypothetical protein FQA39_LY12927 [Lamprigera yunnana]
MNYTKQDILDLIYGEEDFLLDNIDLDEISLALTETEIYTFNNTNVIQIPQLPNENATTFGDLSMLYVGESEQFTGILKAKIILINENSEVKKELSEVLKNNDLGKINNLEEESIKRLIVELNPKLTMLDFDLTMHYNYAVATATETSSYTGTVKINYDYIPFDNVRMETEVARVDAYNSTQKDLASTTTIYIAELGKEEFLNQYSKLSFDFTGYS